MYCICACWIWLGEFALFVHNSSLSNKVFAFSKKEKKKTRHSFVILINLGHGLSAITIPHIQVNHHLL
jgi:hypothetical protein